MKFTVVWTRRAEDKLADLWLRADRHLREAIRSAADACDRMLSKDPQLVGTVRYGTRRVLYVSPLIIHFEVILDDRMARVVDIRLDPSLGASSNGQPS